MRCKRCNEVILVGQSRCKKCGMETESVGWTLTLYRIMSFIGFFALPLAVLYFEDELNDIIDPYLNGMVNIPAAVGLIMLALAVTFVITSFVLEIKTRNLIKCIEWHSEAKAKAAAPVIMWAVFAIGAWSMAFIGSDDCGFALPSVIFLLYHGIMYILALISGKKAEKIEGDEETTKPSDNAKTVSSRRGYDSERDKAEIPGGLYFVYSKLCHSEPREEIWDKGSTGAMRWNATRVADIALSWVQTLFLAIPNIVFIVGGKAARLSQGLSQWLYFGSLIASIVVYITVCLLQKQVARAMEEKRWSKNKDTAIIAAFVIWLVYAAVLTVLMMYAEISLVCHAGFLVVGSIIQVIMLFMGILARKAVKKCEADINKENKK